MHEKIASAAKPRVKELKAGIRSFKSVCVKHHESEYFALEADSCFRKYPFSKDDVGRVANNALDKI